MKIKNLVLIVSVGYFMSSCNDPELIPLYSDEEQLEIDNEILVNYMKKHTIKNFEIEGIKDGDISIYSELGSKLEKLPLGVFYYEVEEGEGIKAIFNDTVTSYAYYYYKGFLTDNTEFDKNFPDEKGRDTVPPSEFYIGSLVDGFSQGLAKMRSGTYDIDKKPKKNTGKAFVFIPSRLGYGIPKINDIPYSAPLIFKIELESVAYDTE